MPSLTSVHHPYCQRLIPLPRRPSQKKAKQVTSHSHAAILRMPRSQKPSLKPQTSMAVNTFPPSVHQKFLIHSFPSFDRLNPLSLLSRCTLSRSHTPWHLSPTNSSRHHQHVDLPIRLLHQRQQHVFSLMALRAHNDSVVVAADDGVRSGSGCRLVSCGNLSSWSRKGSLSRSLSGWSVDLGSSGSVPGSCRHVVGSSGAGRRA